MGQGQSRQQGMSVDEIYSMYIQQQQQMLIQQQQQINDLYQMNLDQQQVPTNITFEQIQQQQQQQQQHLLCEIFLVKCDGLRI